MASIWVALKTEARPGTVEVQGWIVTSYRHMDNSFTPRQRALIHAAALLMKEEQLLNKSAEEWIAEEESRFELERQFIEHLSQISPSRLLALDYIANDVGEIEQL